MKTTLTIEQSKALIDLGVDPKLASKCKFRQITNSKGEPLEKNKIKKWKDRTSCEKATHSPLCVGLTKIEFVDIFTLTDILSILPKEIKSDDTIMGDGFISELQINWDCSQKVWNCAYLALPHPVGVGKAPELIDALYHLLIWCINNGKYNPKNEEK